MSTGPVLPKSLHGMDEISEIQSYLASLSLESRKVCLENKRLCLVGDSTTPDMPP